MAESRQRYIIDFEDCPSDRQTMPELESEERKGNFDEVAIGFCIEDAQREARRCLSCRRCIGCGLCLAVCEPKAIVFDEEDEVVELAVDELIISPEAGNYMPFVRGELGYGTYKNVVSAFEFERILDQDGPYGGLVMRPFDGEIPENMAFILNHNPNRSDGKRNGKDLLAFTLQEACIALDKIVDLDISVFVPKEGDFEPLYSEAEERGFDIRIAKVLEIEEIEDTKDLLVVFLEKGEKKQKEFQLLVLSKHAEIRPELRALHEEWGE